MMRGLHPDRDSADVAELEDAQADPGQRLKLLVQIQPSAPRALDAKQKEKEKKNMEKPIYRIKVEMIGEEQEGTRVPVALREGVECDGFAILTTKGEDGRTSLHNITAIDLATLIAQNDETMGAAIVAKALRDSIAIKKEKANIVLGGIYGGIMK